MAKNVHVATMVFFGALILLGCDTLMIEETLRQEGDEKRDANAQGTSSVFFLYEPSIGSQVDLRLVSHYTLYFSDHARASSFRVANYRVNTPVENVVQGDWQVEITAYSSPGTVYATGQVITDGRVTIESTPTNALFSLTLAE